MKNRIRPPVKIDENERLITNPKVRAHRWRLNVPPSITGGKKQRLDFNSEAEAKAHGEALLEARKALGSDLLARLAARGMTVTSALDYALKHAPLAKGETIAVACKAFIASRRTQNCKERYVDNLQSQLDQFEKKFGQQNVDVISKPDLERFIAGLTGKDGKSAASPKTRGNFIATLKAFFNYAVNEGWRGESPAAKLVKPALDEVPTSILSPAEAAKLIEVASGDEYADVFPAVLVQLYAGPRRSEIPHINWEHFKDTYLRLDRTKIRKQRAVELPETLIAWLAPFAQRTGRLFAPSDVEFNPKDTRNLEDAYTHRLAALAEKAEVALPKNVLRHTAITYRDAFTGDHAATAAWAGNSPAVIERHYRGAATKADAERFYAIKPPADSKLVPITLAAG